MSIYHHGNRALQDRFDTRRLADRLDEVLVSETISDSDAAFIRSLDHFFLATVSPDGVPTVGYKGGAPGFVQVVDDRTLAFPNYNGNGMYLAMGNILENGHGRHAVRQLGEGAPAAAPGLGHDRLRRPLAARLPGGAVRRAGAHHRHLAQLSALHPPDGAGGEIHLRAAGGTGGRRCPPGSGPTGPSTCCPRATRPSTRTHRWSDRRRAPGQSSELEASTGAAPVAAARCCHVMVATANTMMVAPSHCLGSSRSPTR